MEEGLVVKEITVEDCSRLPALLKRVWGKDSDADYWKWKYIDAPFPTKGWLIDDANGNTIAMGGSWRRPTKVGDRIFHPYMTVDAMADPGYRGGKVYRLLKDIMVSEGSNNILYGYVNENSYKAFSVLFKNTIRIDENIPVLSAHVNLGENLAVPRFVQKAASFITKTVYEARIDSYHGPRVEVEAVTAVTEEFDTLWNQVSQEHWWIQDRSRNYLEWRYLQCPRTRATIWAARTDGRLAGYMVSGVPDRPGKKRGYIMDWLVPRGSTDVFHALLHKAVESLIKQQVCAIETWMLSKQDDWLDIWGKYLLTPGKATKWFLLQSPDGLVTELDKFNRNNMMMTFGDSDFLI